MRQYKNQRTKMYDLPDMHETKQIQNNSKIHPKYTPNPLKVTSWSLWCPVGGGEECFSKTSMFDDFGSILASFGYALGPPWETFFSLWALWCRLLFTVCLLFCWPWFYIISHRFLLHFWLASDPQNRAETVARALFSLFQLTFEKSLKWLSLGPHFEVILRSKVSTIPPKGSPETILSSIVGHLFFDVVFKPPQSEQQVPKMTKNGGGSALCVVPSPPLSQTLSPLEAYRPLQNTSSWPDEQALSESTEQCFV